jgi:hypothetical protein
MLRCEAFCGLLACRQRLVGSMKPRENAVIATTLRAFMKALEYR